MVIVVFLGKTGSFSLAGSYFRIRFAPVVEDILDLKRVETRMFVHAIIEGVGARLRACS